MEQPTDVEIAEAWRQLGAVVDGKSSLDDLVVWAAGNCPKLFMTMIRGYGVNGLRGSRGPEPLIAGILAALDFNLGEANQARERAASLADSHGGKPPAPIPRLFPRKGLIPVFELPPLGALPKFRDLAASNQRAVERVGGDWPDELRMFLVERFGVHNTQVPTTAIRTALNAKGMRGVMSFHWPDYDTEFTPDGERVPDVARLNGVGTSVTDNAAVDSW